MTFYSLSRIFGWPARRSAIPGAHAGPAGRPLALALLWLLLVPPGALSSRRTAFAVLPAPSSEATRLTLIGRQGERQTATKAPVLRRSSAGRARARAYIKRWEAGQTALCTRLHSYDGHFEEVLLASQRRSGNDHGVLVFFFAPECPYSKQARGYCAVSAALQRLVWHQIAAIDVESNRRLAEKYALTRPRLHGSSGRANGCQITVFRWFGAPQGQTRFVLDHDAVGQS